MNVCIDVTIGHTCIRNLLTETIAAKIRVYVSRA